MNTSTKAAAFVGALAAVFGASLGIGNAIGPDASPTASHGAHETAKSAPTTPTSAEAADSPGGLMISQQGYTLELSDAEAGAGSGVPVSFAITGPDGKPVLDYEVEHEKRLHLIAVRRDFTGFQHVHPRLSPSGVWSTELDLTPGAWRVFADFTATGAEALTLGADLSVPGDQQPAERPEPSRVSQVGDYTVTLDGDLEAGADAKLALAVERDGKLVTDLEPYLGAYGHLVALRSGDLAYLHVHPDGAPGDGTTQPGPDVVFHTAVPSNGTYHLYLDFKHQGVVRTAKFTVVAAGEPAKQPATSGDGHATH